MPEGSQITVLGGGGRRRQKVIVQDVLRVAADSIEKSVVALHRLLAEVWQVRRTENATLAAVEKGVDSLDVRRSDEPAPRRRVDT